MKPYPAMSRGWPGHVCFNTLRPRQNGRHFADDSFRYIFMNENVWIYIKILLKFVPEGRINNIPSLVQIMAWRRPGDKPLSEPVTVRLLTHICVIRPQWVKLLPPLTSNLKLNKMISYLDLITQWNEADSVIWFCYNVVKHLLKM